jgi:fatty-acyl-CoA synthase
MVEKAYRPGEPYAYPLILKKLLTTPLIYSPDREIVYRDKTRITYRTLNERINRLANGLTRLGVKPGDVVAALEFDSHRYAVPDRFEFVDALPKTSVGKLNKKVLRETRT